jgi:hypothetical protein
LTDDFYLIKRKRAFEVIFDHPLLWTEEGTGYGVNESLKTKLLGRMEKWLFP